MPIYGSDIPSYVKDSKNREALEEIKRIKTAEMILDYEFTGYEIPIRQWASQDAWAASVVKKANRLRFGVRLARRLRSLGSKARIWKCVRCCPDLPPYMEAPTFRELSRKRRREQIIRRIDFLTSKQIS